MQRVNDKEVVCPFYKYTSGALSACEGICGADTVHLMFPTRAALKAHQKAFCYKIHGYEKCFIARENLKKWEEKDDNEKA